MILFVGLTGALRVGKGTVAEFISTLASERGLKVVRYSLSDEIRWEVERRKLPPKRDALRQTANAFRSKLGNSVWAKLVASRITEECLVVMEDEHVLVIIDGIRNSGEVRELRSQFGSQFKLLAVTAPLERIQENVERGGRSDESKQTLLDKEELEKTFETEMGVGEPGFGHNVATCIELADYPPICNDGTLVELEEKVRTLADGCIFPLLTDTTRHRL